MKKIFLATALAAATTLSAQVDFSQTRFGITGGYNYSRVRNAHNPSGARNTFQAGALALIPMDNNDQFYLQPEVVYYGAGETGKDKNAKGKKGYDALYANNYVSVPIFLKGYFSEAESEFFGMFGPRFNFLVNQNVKDPSKDVYTTDGVTYADGTQADGKAATFGFALSAALGYSFKRQLELAAGFDFGLSNTYPQLKKEQGNDSAIKLNKAQHVVNVKLSYIFN